MIGFPFLGRIAQSVEQRTENPRVSGSIPLPAIEKYLPSTLDIQSNCIIAFANVDILATIFIKRDDFIILSLWDNLS